MRLVDLVARLERTYGSPPPPPTTDPWEAIVRENVVYLADDEAREAAFRDLKRKVGIRPKDLLAARASAIRRIAKGRGILAALAPTKLKRAAKVALEDWGGDLEPVLHLPVPEASRALQRFPGIGGPGADRLLLLARRHRVLALDSNGLRVLLRVGYGTERRSYAATYRSVQDALRGRLPRTYPGILAAHSLLQRHGRETCKRSAPRCDVCRLAPDCSFARAAARR
jgi:endonuclease III